MKNLTYLLVSVSFVSFSQDHFENGFEKHENGDFYGAIVDYTKAIEINPNDDYAYYNIGLAKNNLEDYKGAIADYTKAIEINPNNDYAYSKRGLSKYNLEDYNGAMCVWVAVSHVAIGGSANDGIGR